jgi:hypothetical protein
MGGNADLGAKSRSRKPNDYVWQLRQSRDARPRRTRPQCKQTQDTPDGKLDEIKSMIAQLQPRRASTGS